MSTTTLTADARNRALRTFLQGLAIDLLAALGAYLLPIVTSWNAPDDIQWKVLAFGLGKTALSTVASYVMRRFLDGSAVPTPLPPAPVPPPNDDDPAGYVEGV